MPHQWLEGNLPVSAKCAVCDKTCGSVLRLQDWRCLWCKAMVTHPTHSSYLVLCFVVLGVPLKRDDTSQGVILLINLKIEITPNTYS